MAIFQRVMNHTECAVTLLISHQTEPPSLKCKRQQYNYAKTLIVNKLLCNVAILLGNAVEKYLRYFLMFITTH